jgi:hypothetical protein
MKKFLQCLRDYLERVVNRLNAYLNDKEISVETTNEISIETPIEEGIPLQVPSVVVEPSAPIKEGDFLSLCKRLAEMVKQYDMMAKQMPDGEAKDLLEDMSEQIISSMVLGGCQAITKETSFNALRHKPVPFAIIEDGTTIQSTLRIGVELNGVILLHALVRI